VDPPHRVRHPSLLAGAVVLSRGVGRSLVPSYRTDPSDDSTHASDVPQKPSCTSGFTLLPPPALAPRESGGGGPGLLMTAAATLSNDGMILLDDATASASGPSSSSPATANTKKKGPVERLQRR